MSFLIRRNRVPALLKIKDFKQREEIIRNKYTFDQFHCYLWQHKEEFDELSDTIKSLCRYNEVIKAAKPVEPTIGVPINPTKPNRLIDLIILRYYQYKTINPQGNDDNKTYLDKHLDSEAYMIFRCHHPDGIEIEKELEGALNNINERMVSVFSTEPTYEEFLKIEQRFREKILGIKFQAWSRLLEAFTNNIDCKHIAHLFKDEEVRKNCHECLINILSQINRDHDNPEVTKETQFHKAHYLAPTNFIRSFLVEMNWI